MTDEAKSMGVEPDESPTLGKLAEALAKAQGAMKSAPKDSKNPFFNSTYADLASVWGVIREPLATNGLAVVQRVSTTQGGVIITTQLLHSSGEWMRDRLHVVIEQNMSKDGKKQAWIQAFGSAVTYARRYALSAMVGVAAEDDDGEAAAQTARNQRQSQRQEPQKQAAPTANFTGRVRVGKRMGVPLADLDDATLGEIERWCATNDKPEAREMFADITVEWKRRGGPKPAANGAAAPQ